jgi:hypothetical protein
MEIKNCPPPNWNEIKLNFNPPEKAFFPYYPDIYNLSGEKIPEDIIYHEKVHLWQQQAFPSPDIWWTKWIWDKQFRQEQEIEAFARQVEWIKKHINNKAYKDCLNECAENLSKNYKLGITKSQAATLIRKYV